MGSGEVPSISVLTSRMTVGSCTFSLAEHASNDTPSARRIRTACEGPTFDHWSMRARWGCSVVCAPRYGGVAEAEDQIVVVKVEDAPRAVRDGEQVAHVLAPKVAPREMLEDVVPKSHLVSGQARQIRVRADSSTQRSISVRAAAFQQSCGARDGQMGG